MILEVPKELKFPDDLLKDPAVIDKRQVDGTASWDVEARILVAHTYSLTLITTIQAKFRP
jgi:hypothetical protein